MYSCLRLTQLSIALAIGIQLLQPQTAVGQERANNDLSIRAVLSSEVGLDPHPELGNKNCTNGICDDVGNPDRRRGAGSRWTEE